ncbi:MAG: prolyl oligopeptidase family serine peptidase, partial [Gammaproteobacteria bacterium]|nr:prolyl oligopeptidase family serine peptidase [Gammaproteobacteria bacterium]
VRTDPADHAPAAPPLAPPRGAAAMAGVGEPRLFESTLYWVENRPAEGGRVTLLKAEGESTRELTPEPCNVRSRVHEYGGAAYLPTRDAVYFVNAGDQNIHAVDGGGAIRPITDSGPGTRYADLCADPGRGRIIAVTEMHRQGKHPLNALAAVSTETGQASILHQGYDFYASPTVSPSGNEILFLAWDHPNMPWDGTQLLRAPLQGPDIGPLTLVAGGARESVLQPSWLDDNTALYLSDAGGFWNLYRLDPAGAEPVLEDDAEYAGPPWQLGNRDYAVLNERFVAARRHCQGEQSLVLIDIESGFASPLPDTCTEYSHLSADGNSLYFLGTHANATGELARYDAGSRRRTSLVPGPLLDFDDKWLSRPRHIEYRTRDGGSAYAWLYLPPGCAAPPTGGKPPLLVTTHGGPTGAASSVLRLPLQFYTSRGWVVADINYRGSTGYGRHYRDALKGKWGELDVTDCVDAVNHLIAEGLVDPGRIAICGGSAGGYTTLRALTTQTVFRAGASHYGIGDLGALADDTHKFESQYLTELVGSRETMIARSPIHHLDGFSCHVIFFQGSEDRIVPPNQAQSMVAALNRKGIPVAYLEFPGEGHGFREGANIARAIGSEYAFFCRVFDMPVDEDLPDVRIENL